MIAGIGIFETKPWWEAAGADGGADSWVWLAGSAVALGLSLYGWVARQKKLALRNRKVKHLLAVAERMTRNGRLAEAEACLDECKRLMGIACNGQRNSS